MGGGGGRGVEGGVVSGGGGGWLKIYIQILMVMLCLNNFIHVPLYCLSKYIYET